MKKKTGFLSLLLLLIVLPLCTGFSSAKYASSHDVTTELTVNIEASRYTLTLDANGGLFEDGTAQKQITVAYKDPYGSLAQPARRGHTMEGWYTEKTGGTEIRSTDTVEITGNATLYAHWTPNPYTVRFHANAGEDGAVEEQTFTYDTAGYLDENPFEKAGYTFVGWNTDPGGNGTRYTDQAEVKNLTSVRNGTVDLYAQWSVKDYTIRYELNDGGVETENPTVYTIESDTFTLNNPTRAGYTFAGWTGSNGTTPQTAVTIPRGSTGNKSYAANWTPNPYCVQYDANGGSGTMESSSHTYDAEQPLSVNTFERTGHRFLGWNTAADGSGTAYEDGAVVKNLAESGTVVLYAQWQAETVSYTVNHWQQTLTGGSAHNSTNFALADTQTLTATAETKVTPDRRTYTGFAAPAGVEVTVAADGSTVVDYYYTRNSYTVTLKKSTGIGSVTGGGTYRYGASVTIRATASNGYSWGRWTGDMASAAQNHTFTMPAKAVTNTANATLNTYSITYHLNGGTQGSNAVSSYHVTTETFSLPTPSRSGYTFGGWYTTANFSGSAVTQIVKGSTGNKVFYAKWTTATIAFYIDGVEYRADPGMTWRQWVASKYNTGGFYNPGGTGMIGRVTNGVRLVIVDTKDPGIWAQYGHNPYLYEDPLTGRDVYIVSGRNYPLWQGYYFSEAGTPDLMPDEPQEIKLIWSGIDDSNMEIWYPVAEQNPTAGDSYQLAFEPMEGYTMAETITVMVDEAEYVVYTDGRGIQSQSVPGYDPDQNILTIPAELLTSETRTVSILAAAVPMEPADAENAVPAEVTGHIEETEESGKEEEPAAEEETEGSAKEEEPAAEEETEESAKEEAPAAEEETEESAKEEEPAAESESGETTEEERIAEEDAVEQEA